MKPLLCALASIFALSLPIMPASAEPYFFTDYNYVRTTDHSLNGFDAGLGLSFSDRFGLEAGYIYANGHGVSANGGLLDLAYHFPLGSKLSLFTAAGAEYVDAVGAGWGVRAGGGLEYWVEPGLAVRAGARYQSALQDGLLVNVGFIARL